MKDFRQYSGFDDWMFCSGGAGAGDEGEGTVNTARLTIYKALNTEPE